MKTWTELHISLPQGAKGEVDTTCPECSHARKKKGAKCLSVNVEKGSFLCHHCSWRGSLAGGVDGASDPWTWKPKVFTKPSYPVNLPLTPEAQAWFRNRGISQDALVHYQVASGCVYMPQTEQLEDVIQFPYFREGEAINVKYRSLALKDFRMVGGAERLLYGLDDLKDQTMCCCVEGEVDALSLFGCGYPVVSVPDGAPTPNSKSLDVKLNYLNSAMPWLDPLTKIILMTDNDAPGVFLQQELARRLGPERCYTVVYPEGCKDANDVLMTHGLEALTTLVDQATPMPIEGVVDLHSYDAQVQALYEAGMPGGLSTGWPSIDLLYTVKPGRLTIVTGVPGSGKSSVIDALMVNLAKTHDWSFGLYSPENYPPEAHVLRLIEKTMGRSGRLTSDSRLTPEELNNGRNWVADHFWFFGLNEDTLMSVDVLLEQAKSLVRRQGVRGIILDPWSEVEHVYPPTITETQYISLALTKMRKFARVHGVHLWVIAHPTKMYRNKEGEYPLPSLYDVSGGAHWRNKADFGLVIHRPSHESQNPQVEFHVQKCRFREEGQVGYKNLLFNYTSGGFEEDIGGEATF